MKKAILLLSGGIDSTTALYKLIEHNYLVHALIFDYGQTLAKEIPFAMANANKVGATCQVVKIDLGWIGSPCTLLGDQDDIAQHRTLDQINQATPGSYVPFRNGILFAYAVACGETHGINTIVGGCNGLHSGLYWDDTFEFAQAFTQAAQQGTDPGYKPVIVTPYSTVPKWQIVKEGMAMGIDYSLTWSCYRNDLHHCGRCDSCIQRYQAFQQAGYPF